MFRMQRVLIAVGVVLLLVGLLWPWLSGLGLGRLPGDIRVETENGVFYYSDHDLRDRLAVLSLVVWLVRR